MLRTTKNMREKYEKIQSLIFSLIPEKWESTFMYASVIDDSEMKQKGELFFYYLPKGILKKKPINVYEVPGRFNIQEEQYLESVKELYNIIKDLRQDFIDTEQRLWTNLTISIENIKFKIEFSYDEIPSDEKARNEKHIIWRYKYLKIGGDKKEERKILDNYFSNLIEEKKETYETGVYLKTDNNIVIFDKDDNNNTKKEVTIYLKESEEYSSQIEESKGDDGEENGKNQILKT